LFQTHLCWASLHKFFANSEPSPSHTSRWDHLILTAPMALRTDTHKTPIIMSTKIVDTSKQSLTLDKMHSVACIDTCFCGKDILSIKWCKYWRINQVVFPRKSMAVSTNVEWGVFTVSEIFSDHYDDDQQADKSLSVSVVSLIKIVHVLIQNCKFFPEWNAPANLVQPSWQPLQANLYTHEKLSFVLANDQWVLYFLDCGGGGWMPKIAYSRTKVHEYFHRTIWQPYQYSS